MNGGACTTKGKLALMESIKINVTLRQLRAFSRIYDQRSYSAAAEALSMTQGALSHLIIELERQIGFKVFERTTRRLMLTPEGARYLQQAEQVLAQVQKLSDVADDILLRKNMQFRLGATAALIASELQTALYEFSSHYPDICIELKDYPPDELLTAIESGEVDLAIGPTRNYIPPSINQTILFCSQSMLVVSRNHPFAKRPFVRWSEVGDQTFVLHSKRSVLQVKSDSGFDISTCRIIELSQLYSILSVVESGEGITIVAAYAQKYLQVHAVVAVPIVGPQVMFRVGLYDRKNCVRSDSAQAFYDFILKRYLDVQS